MAFATAKFWGLLPHVIWRYPFRYYKELRDFYFASFQTPVLGEPSKSALNFDIEAESFTGDAV